MAPGNDEGPMKTTARSILFAAPAALCLTLALGACGSGAASGAASGGEDPAPAQARAGGGGAAETTARQRPDAPAPRKDLFANSFINRPAPTFAVEQWLTAVPEVKGKMALIDFWATWCPPCRKAIPELNRIHAKFRDRLNVIGLSSESAAAVREMRSPQIDYALAIDTQGRMASAMGVRGIPHIVIVDPEGIVRWEGFPFTPGHELTEDVVEQLLDTYVD